MWAKSCPGCVDRLSERYSHHVGGSFLAGKVAWALTRCMTAKSADYCMLVNEWAWSRSRVCMSRLKVDLGSILESRAWVEMEIQRVKDMYRLKLVSNEINSGFQGLKHRVLSSVLKI